MARHQLTSVFIKLDSVCLEEIRSMMHCYSCTNFQKSKNPKDITLTARVTKYKNGTAYLKLNFNDKADQDIKEEIQRLLAETQNKT